MENVKTLLKALYKEHAPDKIELIDSYLEKYKGKEKQFYVSEKAKYSKKNSITDSKKILEEAMARIAAQKKAKAAVPKSTAKEIKESVPKKPKPEPKPIKKIEKEKVIAKVQAVKKQETLVEQAAKTSLTKAPVVEKTKADIVKEERSFPRSQKEIKNEKVSPLPETSSTTITKPVEKEVPAKIASNKEMPVSKDLSAEKEDIIKEKESVSNDKKEVDKLAEAKARLIKNKKQHKSKKKKSFSWIIIIMIVVLLLISVSFIYINYFSPQEQKVAEAINVEEVTISVDQGKSESVEITKDVAEADGTDDLAVKVEKRSNIDKPKKRNPKPVIRSTQDRLYSNDIGRPSIFVSCFAVKTEMAAQNKIKLLKEYKLDAHYYWIPDMDKQGHSFFKVVVGPFNTVKSAYPSLTTVQERINFDAYILTIK